MNTHIIFIVDKSGSMYPLTKDTIGGFNSFLGEQRKLKDQAYLTTVLFNHNVKLLYKDIDVKYVRDMDEVDYIPEGTTALLDAIGKTLITAKQELDKENKVIIVIITDGYENSSTEYNNSTIKAMIEDCRKNGWEFIFLGANIDSFSVAGSIGITASGTVNYSSNAVGTQSAYDAITKSVVSYTQTGTVSPEWKRDVE